MRDYVDVLATEVRLSMLVRDQTEKESQSSPFLLQVQNRLAEDYFFHAFMSITNLYRTSCFNNRS